MEFLMTYGWAILVVLVVIGALAYFGVLSPAKLLPDKCTSTAGFQCTDYTFGSPTSPSPGGRIKLTNGLGSNIFIKEGKYIQGGSTCADINAGLTSADLT